MLISCMKHSGWQPECSFIASSFSRLALVTPPIQGQALVSKHVDREVKWRNRLTDGLGRLSPWHVVLSDLECFGLHDGRFLNNNLIKEQAI